MCFKHFFLLFFISLFASDLAFAQQTAAKKDSTLIYKNIESFSKRRGFTKFIYRLVFKPVAISSSKKKAKKKVYKKLIQKPYSAFEGKTIRTIHIETLDPFGYSISDTSVIKQNFFFKSGNMLHIKTQPITIRNLLLIRQNQFFDSLLVKESERLVRSSGYVRDVSFFVKATAKNSDSVDVFIRELDTWSIIPKGTMSPVRFTFNLVEKNFLGLGHDFQNGLSWFPTTNKYAFNTNYYIQSIRNTYINTTLHYGNDEFGNSIKSIVVDRPFFSPFAKWAAGVSFSQQFHKALFGIDDSLLVLPQYKFFGQDHWVGNAIQIFKGNTEDKRTTNFISTLRFSRIRYSEKPTEEIDPLHMYSNENLYLASIGIATRKYVQDKYIFAFGVTEDVPVGKVFSLTGGYLEKNNSGHAYLGAKISYGYYYPKGYLSANVEYGTFFSSSHIQQGVLAGSVNYFTGLIEIGKWKFRHFIKTQSTIGINRFPYDSLTLNDGYGIDGFNSPDLSGTQRLILTIQTQSYAPWNFIGFRFGPYFICSLGMLGSAAKGFNGSKIYSQIGFGVLIKNENLVINSFQISIAFYPIIPGYGLDVFKMNSFKTTDFGFRDFAIGKPAIITYQ